MLEVLGVKGKALVAMKDPSPTVLKAANNIPGVKVVPVEGINSFDLCLYDTLIITRDALGFLEESVQR